MNLPMREYLLPVEKRTVKQIERKAGQPRSVVSKALYIDSPVRSLLSITPRV